MNTRLLHLVLLAFAATVALGCGDEEGLTSADGRGCDDAGAAACFDNVGHLCKYENGQLVWRPREDCGASSTPNCECALVAGDTAAWCLVDGDTTALNQCSGERLD